MRNGECSFGASLYSTLPFSTSDLESPGMPGMPGMPSRITSNNPIRHSPSAIYPVCCTFNCSARKAIPKWLYREPHEREHHYPAANTTSGVWSWRCRGRGVVTMSAMFGEHEWGVECAIVFNSDQQTAAESRKPVSLL